MKSRRRTRAVLGFLEHSMITDSIITLVVSGLISILVAIVTALLTTRYKINLELKKERAKGQLEQERLQKYQYFSPFKYAAAEFRRRISHIVYRLSEKGGEKFENMIKRFQVNFDSKQLEWFFNDDVNSRGGYFITSTIYTNCMLFYWIKRIQFEYPFIPLKLEQIDKDLEHRYSEFLKSEQFMKARIQRQCDIYDFIANIRIVISGEGGIPYGMHDSLGDLLYDYEKQKVITYAEFCDHLLDKNFTIKFSQIIKFWNGIVSLQGSVNELTLSKLRHLITILELLKVAEIDEQ